MSDYDKLRHFADSYGLIFMALTFLLLVGWNFLPGPHARSKDAAMMIFDEEQDDG